ncbi:MAG: pantetheine-phosphate adenylyltransferase [Rikenellaceae bacterium]
MIPKRAVYAGSFDPFTIGHYSIVEKSLLLFDEVVIAIGVNINKKEFMSIEDRVASIKELFASESRVKVTSYDSLTTTFCRDNNIRFIVRGVRDIDDYIYEHRIASVNKTLDNSIETVLLFSKQEYDDISSSTVREIFAHKGDITKFIPATILKYLK